LLAKPSMSLYAVMPGLVPGLHAFIHLKR